MLVTPHFPPISFIFHFLHSFSRLLPSPLLFAWCSEMLVLVLFLLYLPPASPHHPRVYHLLRGHRWRRWWQARCGGDEVSDGGVLHRQYVFLLVIFLAPTISTCLGDGGVLHRHISPPVFSDGSGEIIRQWRAPSPFFPQGGKRWKEIKKKTKKEGDGWCDSSDTIPNFVKFQWFSYE